MMQQRTAGYRALCNLREAAAFPPAWETMAELEQAADAMHATLLRERERVAGELGGAFRLAEWLDGLFRTDETEHMDNEQLPQAERLELVRLLDRLNLSLGLPQRYTALLEPLMLEMARDLGRPVKVLEIAGGTGGLSLALAEASGRSGLPLQITCSDVMEASLDEGRRRAEEQGVAVDFRYLDAFDLGSLRQERFDLVLIAQSMHHFSPGRLAVMIAQAERSGARTFIGIDGQRSLAVSLGMPLVTALQANADFMHDGLVSARKFYSEPELDAIAATATGRCDHLVAHRWPGTLLYVRFDGTRPSETIFPLP